MLTLRYETIKLFKALQSHKEQVRNGETENSYLTKMLQKKNEFRQNSNFLEKEWLQQNLQETSFTGIVDINKEFH